MHRGRLTQTDVFRDRCPERGRWSEDTAGEGKVEPRIRDLPARTGRQEACHLVRGPERRSDTDRCVAPTRHVSRGPDPAETGFAPCATDIRNWKTNYNKSAGCTDSEINAFKAQLNPEEGSGHHRLVDVWRERNPELEGH